MTEFNYTTITLFDENERLWLMGDVIAKLGDDNEQLSAMSMIAGDVLYNQHQRDKVETIDIIAWLTMTKLKGQSYEVTNQDTKYFCNECRKNWGESLTSLSIHDALWIIHQGIYGRVNGEKLNHRDELDLMAEQIEAGLLSTNELKQLAIDLICSIVD